MFEQIILEQQVHRGGHQDFGEAIQDGFPHRKSHQGKVFGHCQESFSKVRPKTTLQIFLKLFAKPK